MRECNGGGAIVIVQWWWLNSIEVGVIVQRLW